jgi:uncharacterized protein YdeI (YjbR/CyaY-like superfamily)
MNSQVNGFMRHESRWKAEFEKLREICLASGMTEEFKWMHPCYTVGDDKNVVLIHGFKDYFGLAFFKGSIMKDPKKLLVQQTKNVQATRQLRFTSLEEVIAKEPIIKSYIREAIKIEKAGIAVPMKKTEEFEMPEEFAAALKKSAKLKKAFEALTPGRQRGYLLYFAGAKQSKTREARIEKCTPNILIGKGLEDR